MITYSKKIGSDFLTKGSDPFRLLTPQHCFLPFMLVTPAAFTQGIAKFELIADETGVVTSLSTSLLQWSSFLGRDYYLYHGQDHGQFLTCGFYYLVVTHNDGSRYFSEDFYVTPSGYCGNTVINGHFTTDLVGWHIQAGSITWVNGRAHFAVGGGTKQMDQVSPVNGRIRVTFTIENWTGSGGAYLQIGGTIVGRITGNGVYSFTGDGTGGARMYFTSDSARGFDLDDVEVASISSNAMDCNIMMEWGGVNNCDFANQYYGSGFVNRFIFPENVDIFESKWKITKNGTKNGNDSDIDQFSKRQEIHHIELIAPHYVAQALIEMSIHPDKTFVSKRCFGRAKMYDVVVTPKPVFDSSMYQIDIDFSLSEVVETKCCGDGLERCLEPCQIAFENVPLGDCTEGVIYIGSNQSYATCGAGATLVETPCESGLMSNAGYIAGTNSPYWLWNNLTNEWDQAPAIWDIELVSGSSYRIYSLIIPNTSGQLQYSTDGGLHWINFGNIHSASDWMDGIIFTIPENTTYLLRIQNRAGTCDYGYSPELSYTTGDTEPLSDSWVANNYHKIWRIGFDNDDVLTVSINLLDCNGVDALGGIPYSFVINQANASYGIGTDGQLYLTNLTDKINLLLAGASGYEVFDDMRVIKYPTGESFHFEIHLDWTDGVFTEDDDYTYDYLTGFSYI